MDYKLELLHPNKKNLFISRVVSILLSKLLFSLGLSMIPLFVIPVRLFIRQNIYMPILIFIGFICSIVTLYYNRKNIPYNYILLAILSMFDSFILGIAFTSYAPIIVTKTLIFSSVTSGGIITYAYLNKDYTHSWYKNLAMCIMCILLSSIFVQYIIQFGDILSTIISSMTTFLFAILLYLDTWNIFKNYNEDEYILAVIDIYLSIINLTLYSLECFKNLSTSEQATEMISI